MKTKSIVALFALALVSQVMVACSGGDVPSDDQKLNMANKSRDAYMGGLKGGTAPAQAGAPASK